MSRALDGLTLLLLVLAVGLLGWQLLSGQEPSHVAVPLLLPEDEPGSLHLPEADQRAIRARAGAVGEVITIEDLIRVVVALVEGRPEEAGLGTLPPLSEEERARLRVLLEQARQHRDALLEVEGALSQAERSLNDAALEMAEELPPEQRRWIQENRDRISVGGVEESYWQRAREGLN